MIHVVATIDLLEGKRSEFLQTFGALVPSVRAEKGCIEYGAAVDLRTSLAGQPPLRAHTVTVLEKWQSVGALEAHLQTPHMQAFFAQMGPLFKEVRIQVLEPA